MKSIDPRAFEYALSRITDGSIFEEFAQDLLCQILGQDFVPIWWDGVAYEKVSQEKTALH